MGNSHVISLRFQRLQLLKEQRRKCGLIQRINLFCCDWAMDMCCHLCWWSNQGLYRSVSVAVSTILYMKWKLEKKTMQLCDTTLTAILRWAKCNFNYTCSGMRKITKCLKFITHRVYVNITKNNLLKQILGSWHNSSRMKHYVGQQNNNVQEL